jgi:drug/metabolite transporter (DMT)-like permease
MSVSRASVFGLTLLTLIAFASNSIFCRTALLIHNLGALTFTIVRLGSGTIMLLPILLWPEGNRQESVFLSGRRFVFSRSAIGMAASLFFYALFFSLAYVELQAATGAIILFPTVQITMLGLSLALGNRLNRFEWVGFALALGGLVYLLLPGIAAPPMGGAVMMILSGISWGIYSILGQFEPYPVIATARNFLYSVPPCLILVGILLIGWRSEGSVSLDGLILAVVSGAFASGLGYVLWYLTLRRISTTMAFLCQLAVPIIAGFGGVIFLNEHVSFRLIVASFIILSGLGTAIAGRRPVAGE